MVKNRAEVMGRQRPTPLASTNTLSACCLTAHKDVIMSPLESHNRAARRPLAAFSDEDLEFTAVKEWCGIIRLRREGYGVRQACRQYWARGAHASE